MRMAWWKGNLRMARRRMRDGKEKRKGGSTIKTHSADTRLDPPSFTLVHGGVPGLHPDCAHLEIRQWSVVGLDGRCIDEGRDAVNTVEDSARSRTRTAARMETWEGARSDLLIPDATSTVSVSDTSCGENMRSLRGSDRRRGIGNAERQCEAGVPFGIPQRRRSSFKHVPTPPNEIHPSEYREFSQLGEEGLRALPRCMPILKPSSIPRPQTRIPQHAASWVLKQIGSGARLGCSASRSAHSTSSRDPWFVLSPWSQANHPHLYLAGVPHSACLPFSKNKKNYHPQLSFWTRAYRRVGLGDTCPIDVPALINYCARAESDLHLADCRRAGAPSARKSWSARRMTITGPVKAHSIKAASGNTVTRVFCGNCGSAITHLTMTGNFADFANIPIATELFLKDRWTDLAPIA
ncbi:hypothetical protein B0H13DRAFT_1855405 [Mycena leptocephala]|nr:hypothetical protein B0H13DRAFT_1855405 [Mycena leptocephala]